MCANRLGKALSYFFCCTKRNSRTDVRAALHQRALEETVCKGRGQQAADIHRARRMAEYHYVLRVASKVGNIFVNPIKSRDLVEERIVPR